MSRKKTEINPIRSERVKEIMRRENIKEKALAIMIYQTQQSISRIINNKCALTEETAKRIIDAFPEKGYRLQWLLGYDDYMTVDEYKEHFVREVRSVDDAAITLLDYGIRNVCLAEGIEVPNLDNIPENILLTKMLLDYAESIMWKYLHRDVSQLWGYLDNIPEVCTKPEQVSAP